MHIVNLELHIESDKSDDEIEEFEMANEDDIQDEILNYESDSEIEDLDG